MQLEGTDLLAINRGGVNYKVTGADLTQGGVIQPTDVVMVQRGSTLYKVAAGTLSSSFDVLEETDFVLVQRGDELYGLHPNFVPALIPSFTMNLDSAGLGSSDRAISIEWKGARAPGGFAPQVQFPDSPNRNTYFFGASGDTWFVPSQLGAGTSRAVIYGAFDYINFEDSLALVSMQESAAGAVASMIPTPAANFGQKMFSRCPKLTTIPLDIPFKNLFGTFIGCEVFNQDISTINTTGVEDFYSCFVDCIAFDQDISPWDVSSATELAFMFAGATSFNQNLNSWGPLLSNVFTFSRMFQNASSYNQPMNLWDVSGASPTQGSLPGMDDFFYNATVFNQDLSGWCVTNFPQKPFNFADGSALEANNYPVWGTCP